MKDNKESETNSFIEELMSNYKNAISQADRLNKEELEKIGKIQKIGYDFISSGSVRYIVRHALLESSRRGIKDIRFFFDTQQNNIGIDPLDFDQIQEQLIKFGVYQAKLIDIITLPEELIKQIEGLRSQEEVQLRRELLIQRLHEDIVALGLVDTQRSFYMDPRDPFYVGRKGNPKLEFCVTFDRYLYEHR